MPPNDGLWLHDRHDLQDRREPSIKLDQEPAIAVRGFKPELEQFAVDARCAPFGDIAFPPFGVGRRPAGRPVVAVLPFLTLSAKPNDDYFGDGLTEDIISALGRFSELTVLARNAVFPYKGKQLRFEDLGRELGARYLVEGSVRRSPDRLRISVQLADASNGTLLWSRQYDEEPKDIFSIEDNITRRIAGALAVKLTRLEQARSAAKPPSNLEAYDLVLRGRALMARHTRSANVEARSLFQRAIDIDPSYAAAYVGLGNA